MAIKTVTIPTQPLVINASPKTGVHQHQCSRYNHSFDCQYSTKCHLEKIPSAQKIIDDMCPACHNLQNGNYAS